MVSSSSSPRGPSGSVAARPLTAVLLLALLVRLLALWAAADARPVFDERAYVLRAEALLDGQGFVGSYQSLVRDSDSLLAARQQYPGAYQPPLYALFMAAVMALSGRSLLAVKLAQVVLSVVTVGVVYALGRAWLDERCGLVAAGACALYPNLIAFSHCLWSETLFIALLLTAILLLTRGPLPGPGTAAAAGILLGGAALTRSLALYLTPLLLLWVVLSAGGERRRAGRHALIAALLCGLVVTPWVVRNTRLHGGLVLIDTSGPFNLWRGNNATSFSDRPPAPARAFAPPFDRIPLQPLPEQTPQRFVRVVTRALGKEAPSDLEITRAGRRLAWAYILDHPGIFLSRVWVKLVGLWNPTSFLLRHFRFGAYGAVSPAVESALSWAAVISYLVVLALGIGGAVARWRSRHSKLLLLLLIFVSGAHVVTFGLTRYRLPLMPLLMVFAAGSLTWGWDALFGHGRSGGGRPDGWSGRGKRPRPLATRRIASELGAWRRGRPSRVELRAEVDSRLQGREATGSPKGGSREWRGSAPAA